MRVVACGLTFGLGSNATFWKRKFDVSIVHMSTTLLGIVMEPTLPRPNSAHDRSFISTPPNRKTVSNCTTTGNANGPGPLMIRCSAYFDVGTLGDASWVHIESLPYQHSHVRDFKSKIQVSSCMPLPPIPKETMIREASLSYICALPARREGCLPAGNTRVQASDVL